MCYSTRRQQQSVLHLDGLRTGKGGSIQSARWSIYEQKLVRWIIFDMTMRLCQQMRYITSPSKGTSLVIADSFFDPLMTLLLPSLFAPLPPVGDSDIRY